MVANVCDVLIIGSGPAGLSTALQLKRLGVTNIQVVDREETPGGNPRLCHHIGFGSRDLRWIYTGPEYAQEYLRLAEKAQIDIHPLTSVTGWVGSNHLHLTSPKGIGQIEAKAVVLATGCRERSRAARLIPGSRPQGIYTTGSLQRFVYQYGQKVGHKAIVVGAELISLSTVMTLAHAGIEIVGVVTEFPHHQIFFPYSLAKWFILDWKHQIPIFTRSQIRQIFGSKRVEAVEIHQLDSQSNEKIACDTVVFTGNWIPEHELARLGGLIMDPASLGPQVDPFFRTSAPGVFAAGNLLRGAETADIAALEGRATAHSILNFLEKGTWIEHTLPISVSEEIAWVSPNSVSYPAQFGFLKAFRFRVKQFHSQVKIQIKQGTQIIHQQSFSQLRPLQSIYLETQWLSKLKDNIPIHIELIH